MIVNLGNYLTLITKAANKIILTRLFRLGYHTLRIQTGKYENRGALIPVEERRHDKECHYYHFTHSLTLSYQEPSNLLVYLFIYGSQFLSFASFYQDSVTCLADVLENTLSPVPKVFLFYGAVAYQTAYFLKKANICPGMKYGDLKKIVLNSGKCNF